MERDIPQSIRCSSFKHSNQFPYSIEVNPITNPLQVLKNRLKSQNPKTHYSRSKSSHTHIGTNINQQPISSFLPKFAQNILNSDGNVGLSEGFVLEDSLNVFVGFFGQIPEIRECVEKRVFDTFDDVCNYGVTLWGFEAIERGDFELEVLTVEIEGGFEIWV